MSQGVVLIDSEISRPSYLNGRVVKVHEEDVYDVRFSNGQVESYIENVSSVHYNSGDYVAVLVIKSGNTQACKIIGRGRKMSAPSSILKVTV
jgi:hypothetical protein